MVASKTKERLGFAARLAEALSNAGVPDDTKRRSWMAKRWGISTEAARKWLQGEAVPTEARRPQIAADLRVPYEWLATGRGAKEEGFHVAERVRAYEIRDWDSPDDLDPVDDVEIPVFDIKLVGGVRDTFIPEYVETKKRLPFSRAWLRGKRAKADFCKAFPVDGNSMYPTLSDGDLVLVNTADTSVVDGRIYALIAGGPKIKRLKRRADGTLIIISDNQAFGQEEVPPDQQENVIIIGRAINRSGDL